MAEKEPMYMPTDVNTDRRAKFEEEKRKEHLKEEKIAKEKAFDETLQDLVERTVDIYLEQGPDHFMTNLMITFLDLSIQMKSMMKTLSSINLAMECLTEAINFIDSAVKLDETFLQDTTTTKYGFWANLKRKRELKKAQKNNIGRVQAVINGIIGKYEMAQDMLDMFSNLGDQINGLMNKSIVKRNKKVEKMKKGGASSVVGGATSNANSPAMQMIQQALVARGIAPASKTEISDGSNGVVGGAIGGATVGGSNSGVSSDDSFLN